MLRVSGRPSLADFDVLRQKLQEDADPDRQKPALTKIDSMQFVDVARVELFENRDKPIGGDIIPDYERGQPNKSDTADGKRTSMNPATAEKSEMPGFIKPQLATLKARAPSGSPPEPGREEGLHPQRAGLDETVFHHCRRFGYSRTGYHRLGGGRH